LTFTESAPAVTDLEGDVTSLGVGRGVAALAVGGLAVVLAVLPAMVGLGLASGAVAYAAAGLGGLAAAWGGVRLAVAVWGLVSALAESPGEEAGPAPIG
jgi:hypothetical protein